MKGKTIRLYLTDGVPTGVLTAEIINWAGKVIVAPRSNLADLARRDEARRTGVYCLVGPDPEAIGKDRVYLGEAESTWPGGPSTYSRLAWTGETFLPCSYGCTDSI